MAVKRYNGTSWDTVAGLGAQGAAATSSSITTWVKTASGGETSLTGSSDSSTTLAYTPGQEQFFINGVLQVRGSDYTATNGTSITGITALVAGDIATVTSVNAFSVTGAVPLSTVTANGDLIVGTSSGAVGRLGIGSTSQVLTVSGGVPTWATPAGGGGMTFISRTSFSNVASQSFNGSFTSSYETYFMVIEELWAGNHNDETHLQFTYAGPTTQTATYYAGAASLPYNSASWTSYGTNNLAHLILSADNGLSNEPFTGQYYFYRVGNASERAYINGQSFSAVGSALEVFAGQQFTARTYTGFLLKSSSSNITGTVTLFGVNKS
jgi:hypothetical protein